MRKMLYLCSVKLVNLWIEKHLKAKRHLPERRSPRCNDDVWTMTKQHDGCI